MSRYITTEYEAEVLVRKRRFLVRLGIDGEYVPKRPVTITDFQLDLLGRGFHIWLEEDVDDRDAS